MRTVLVGDGPPSAADVAPVPDFTVEGLRDVRGLLGL
jgi:hypothetical protein